MPTDMPVSVGRHNLARIRKQLKLTQADVAKLVGCSPATIKAVEIDKLTLSDGLASRISQFLRIDKEWLLKNDLGAPLPAGYSLPTPQEATGRAPDAQTVVILELFSRLFAVIAKMEKTQGRAMMELAIAIMMDDLKKQTKPLPNCQPGSLAGSHSIEFLLQHPDLFDRDLKQWVDLKGLLKSNLQLSSQPDDEIEEAPSPMRRKLPSRTPASPSPGGRRKTRASS